MELKECAEILRSMIRHRELEHQEVIHFRGDDGEERCGKINPNEDVVYQAMKTALKCVEEKL